MAVDQPAINDGVPLVASSDLVPSVVPSVAAVDAAAVPSAVDQPVPPEAPSVAPSVAVDQPSIVDGVPLVATSGSELADASVVDLCPTDGLSKHWNFSVANFDASLIEWLKSNELSDLQYSIFGSTVLDNDAKHLNVFVLWKTPKTYDSTIREVLASSHIDAFALGRGSIQTTPEHIKNHSVSFLELGELPEFLIEAKTPGGDGFLRAPIPGSNGDRRTRWVFTWNNYPLDYLEKLRNMPDMEFVKAGLEKAPSTGTPHIQGFVRFHKPKRLSDVRRGLPEIGFWEISEAKDQVVINYCCKGEQSKEEWKKYRHNGPNYGLNADVFTLGDALIVEKKTPGKRSDLDAFTDAVKAGDITTVAQIREQHSNIHAKYTEWSEEYLRIHTCKSPEFSSGLTAEWQIKMLQCVSTPAAELLANPETEDFHRRTIWFVVDEKGNAGKTKFAHYMKVKYPGTLLLDHGKVADMSYHISHFEELAQLNIVILDSPRQSQSRFNYSVLEKLKNGRVFNTKYRVFDRFHPVPHIIVMTNHIPMIDSTVLSYDRVQILRLDPDDPVNGPCRFLNVDNAFGDQDEFGMQTIDSTTNGYTIFRNKKKRRLAAEKLADVLQNFVENHTDP